MGAYVLVITMGLKAIYEAARLLELPKTWNSLKIAEYLLAQADKAFPALKGTYYPGVIAENYKHKDACITCNSSV